MLHLIIGNACSFFAMISDAVSSSRKTVKGVLMVQIISQLFYGASAIVLKGYSAAVQNAISILRNLFATRERQWKYTEWLLLLLAVGLGLIFNNLAWVGLLPVVANLEYALAVIYFKKNEKALKIAFLINACLFLVFNIFIQNYVGVIANCLLIITTFIFILKNNKQSHRH